jgi:hypothetical protein
VVRQPRAPAEMVSRANGRRTVPQIFIDGRHVGGCDDLYALDARQARPAARRLMRAALLSSPLLTTPRQPRPPPPPDRGGGRGGAGLLARPRSRTASRPRARLSEVAATEAEDPSRRPARGGGQARRLDRRGSLASGPRGRRAARQPVAPDRPEGGIAARYDKIHMFDVDVSAAETWRESQSFRPGDRAVVARTPWPPRASRSATTCASRISSAPWPRPARGAARPRRLHPPHGRGALGGAPARPRHRDGLLCAGRGADRRARRRAADPRPFLAVAPWGGVLADAGRAPG